jgi:hypothetical protein
VDICLDCFQFLSHFNKAATNICTQVFVQSFISFFFSKYTAVEWQDDSGTYMANFLHSYQQCVEVLVPPLSHQYLVWLRCSPFNLSHHHCCFSLGFLTCISLMTDVSSFSQRLCFPQWGWKKVHNREIKKYNPNKVEYYIALKTRKPWTDMKKGVDIFIFSWLTCF